MESPPEDQTAGVDERPQVRASAGLSAFYQHLHPRMVRERTLKFRATLGLGLLTLTSLALVTFSGLVLMVVYVPSVERAHASLQDLIAVVPLGALFRNLHRWTAHAAVVFCLLHMLRTILWGSYRAGHRRVWLVGVSLLLVTLATSFSGYLLPWDQDAYWTVTVGTSLVGNIPLVGEPLRQMLLGGDQVGQATLTRFFVLHVIALPSLGTILLVIHLFRLRRAGGLARGPKGSGHSEALVSSSRLIQRETALFLLACSVFLLVSIWLHARLGPAPDLMRPDNPPKAPWFLAGLQEAVSYSALFGGVVLPLVLFALLALLPWLGPAPNDGALLPGLRARLSASVAVLLACAATVAAVLWWGDSQAGTSDWANPASVGPVTCALGAAGTWLFTRQRALAVQALVLGILSVLVVLTLTGWFYRGPDWQLVYHPGPGHGAARITEPAPTGGGS